MSSHGAHLGIRDKIKIYALPKAICNRPLYFARKIGFGLSVFYIYFDKVAYIQRILKGVNHSTTGKYSSLISTYSNKKYKPTLKNLTRQLSNNLLKHLLKTKLHKELNKHKNVKIWKKFK